MIASTTFRRLGGLGPLAPAIGTRCRWSDAFECAGFGVRRIEQSRNER
jgi:hypothetical protein